MDDKKEEQKNASATVIEKHEINMKLKVTAARIGAQLDGSIHHDFGKEQEEEAKNGKLD